MNDVLLLAVVNALADDDRDAADAIIALADDPDDEEDDDPPPTTEGFDPSQPRDKDGKFAEKPGGGSDGDDGKSGPPSPSPPNPHENLKPGESDGHGVRRTRHGILTADPDHAGFDPTHFDEDGSPWHPDERAKLYDAEDDPYQDKNPYGDIYAGRNDDVDADDLPIGVDDITDELADIADGHAGVEVAVHFAGVDKPGDDLDRKADDRKAALAGAIQKATADQRAMADEYHAKLTTAGVSAEAANEVHTVHATHAAAVAGAAQRWQQADAESHDKFHEAERIANELETARGYALEVGELPPRPGQPAAPTGRRAAQSNSGILRDTGDEAAYKRAVDDQYAADVRDYQADVRDYRAKLAEWRDKVAEVRERAKAKRREELRAIRGRQVAAYGAAVKLRKDAGEARRDYLKRSRRLAERLSAVAVAVYQRSIDG